MILETNLADITEGTLPQPRKHLRPPGNQYTSNDNQNFRETQDQSNNENNGSHLGFYIDQSLLDNLQDKFLKFYKLYINKPVEERNYDIKRLLKINGS